MSVPRLLRDTGQNLEVDFSVGGIATDADGTVTVTVLRADGTALFTDAAAGKTTPPASGRYRKVLTPANLPEVDLLSCTWKATFTGAADQVLTQAEVVGGYLYTLPEARAFNPRSQTAGPLADTSKYPDANLLTEHWSLADDFELICGYSMVPRYGRAVLSGWDAIADRRSYSSVATCLQLPHRKVTSILAATVDGDVLDAGELALLHADPRGILRRTDASRWPTGFDNITVAYVHGLPSVPGPITRAALLLTASHLAGGDVNPRAMSVTNELGTTQLATAGYGRWEYGLPEADAILRRYARKPPGIA
jgi:hypothetical protein